MIDALLPGVRMAVAALGLLAPDVQGIATMGAIALVLASVAVLTVAVVGTITPESGWTSSSHPTRAAELATPLAQSDPDADGHVRRRGPSHAAAAA